jgi:hypothetical protein
MGLMQFRSKTQTQIQPQDAARADGYHILIEQSQDVWNAKLEDSMTGEVVVFQRPIDLVRWLERRAKLEPTSPSLA